MSHRRLTTLIRNVFAAPYCPAQLPWFSAGDIGPLKRVAYRQERAHRRRLGEGIDVAMIIVLWPIVTTVQAIYLAARKAARDRDVAAIRLMRQFVQQLWLANRHNVSPRMFYTYRLWEDERRRHAKHLMFKPSPGHLLAVIGSDPAERRILQDKLAFIRHCDAHGLATIPAIARFSGGRCEWISAETLPRRDLFAKPVQLNQGKGAECWRWAGDGWERRGVHKNHDAMIEHFRARGDYMITPRLVNHPALAGLTPGGLATLRIVTCKNSDGRTWALLTVLRMPVGDSEVDNMSAGGIAAAVDGDGLLSPAVGKKVSMGHVTHHPTTGEMIAGLRLPLIDEARSLCATAHESFPRMASIGWDVAITPDGPVLVEGNVNWGTEIAQLPSGVPLGRTRLVEWAHRELVEGTKA